MRTTARLRHAIVLATVATLTAALIPTAASAVAPGDGAALPSAVQAAEPGSEQAEPDEQADAEEPSEDVSVEQTDGDPAPGTGADAPDGETPEDVAPVEGSTDAGEPQDDSAEGSADGGAPAEEPGATDGSASDAGDPAELQTLTPDPAGTDDPRFTNNAGMAKNAVLTPEVMDRMAMSTGDDEAILETVEPELRASLRGWNAGNIISDRELFNGSTMSLSAIKSFLAEKVPNCQSGYTCLPEFRQNTNYKAPDRFCDGYTARTGESAAAIIYRVAKSCDINPKALIVMLQKEQGLVTHVWPSDWRYTIAMGMACPDTAACDTRYYGFQNQVYGAARQLQVYTQDDYFSWYPVGKTSNVRYSPNAACGSSPVTIQNKATAALYYYTPYQPNRAALNAGYGTGDSCSTYGNRNFYNYYTDWFGPTRTSPCTVPSGVSAKSGAFVTTVDLNARKAPSTGCDTGISSLPKGTIVKATRQTAGGGWYEVVTEQGRRWVSTAYLKRATTAQAACVTPSGTSGASREYVVTSSTSAKLGPWAKCTTGAKAVGEGTMVQATRVSATGNWLRIRTSSGERWIARDKVSICLQPKGTGPASRAYLVKNGVDAEKYPMAKCGTSVDHYGTGTSPSRYIGDDTLVKATRVSKSGNWLRIRTGAGDRWIPRDEVTICSDPAGTRSTSRTYVVTDRTRAVVSPLQKCAGADHFGTGTGPRTLGAGTAVSATRVSYTGKWVEIRTSVGLRWVKRSDLRLR
ncbi:SH3 domain-containing protein [Microbacterium halophytorum]|uniref:SH3 domain-containing protein n=1 Tax=Microbacterium halophytorum TaxID=2067568 RepID=UPI001319C3E1|nr:SH3 domain-containing protein [Microbacterium halophytorum]